MSTTCLAISSFRNDDSVIRLLERAQVDVSHGLFSEVLVVDSLGTGRLPEELLRRGWSWVHYRSADENLGSAGNLAMRLLLGRDRGHRFVFALNHDGAYDAGAVETLIRFSVARPDVGVAYPLRFIPARAGYDLTGTRPFGARGHFTSVRPEQPAIRVRWGSSNGALYSTLPLSQGLHPWSELWMGWEDLGYGWLLEKNGYSQFIVTSANAQDPYEYRVAPVLGVPLRVTEKPPWYSYYHSRNLMLVARWCGGSPGDYARIAARVAQELVLIGLIRSQKRARLGLLTEGMLHGVLGRSGKGRVP